MSVHDSQFLNSLGKQRMKIEANNYRYTNIDKRTTVPELGTLILKKIS